MSKPKIALLVVCLIFIFYLGGAFYYYRFSKPFEVPLSGDIDGLAYTNTLRIITEDMVNHWPVNDLAVLPSNLLDNPQNYRLGQLEALRYATRLLRANLSRMRAEDPINPYVDAAYNSFAIDPESMILPRAEFKYSDGLEALTQYAASLTRDEAKFYARNDTLREVIEEFIILLDSAGQRLRAVSNEVGHSFFDIATNDTQPQKHIEHKSSFLSYRQTDDAFYFARGVAYVLSHLLVAIQHDFQRVIETRQADALFLAIIPDLEACQFEPWIVIAAAQDSMFANHPLNMQAHIVNARQKLRAISNILGGTTIGN
ncbi:MAG: DUF2333 family protein [Candidatus Competibacteraceae bacterium]|nr:DUF2333 family protein [Candidatus Competibacteraceae bacterium]